MAKVSALAGLKEEMGQSSPELAASDSSGRSTAAPRARAGRPPATGERKPGIREQRKALTVYFPPEVSKELKKLAAEEETTLQALVGEALDLLRRNRGQHPFGVR